MLYISTLLGRPVVDTAGGSVATIKDLIIRLEEPGYPPLAGLVARTVRRDFFVPISLVTALGEHGARLNTSKLDLLPFKRRDSEVLLAHDVLDRQLIDVDGRRVVRANDIAIAEAENQWRIVGVDVGPWALVRRLAPTGVVRAGQPALLDWAQVERFDGTTTNLRLSVAHDQIAKLHPADIARIVESVSDRQANEIVAALDDETAADTFEEMDEQRQADLIARMDEARAADVLEEMAPDEAADLLADLPPEKATALLEEMQHPDAQEVQFLLKYSEDSAGGIMTTEYVCLPKTQTTLHAISSIRTYPDRPDRFYDVYVLESDTDRKLTGIVSLQDLLLAHPDDQLLRYMVTDVQTAQPTVPAHVVAEVMIEYNLLALPVVDEHGAMLGVVTIDDALDVVLPEETREHRLRLFRRKGALRS